MQRRQAGVAARQAAALSAARQQGLAAIRRGRSRCACVGTAADGKPQRSCTLRDRRREADIALGTQPGCPTWLLANDGELGYYRAAYGSDVLQKLLGADGRKQLDLPETVGLLDDLHALVSAGRVPLGDVLAMAPSLATDERRHVQRFVIGSLAGLHEHLVPTALRPNYARAIDKIYSQKAHTLGWTAKPGDDEDTRLLRPQLVGLVADEGEDKALASRGARRSRSSGSPIARRSAPTSSARCCTSPRATAIARSSTSCTPRRSAPAIVTIAALMLGAIGDFRDPAIAKAALQIVSSTSSIRASRCRSCGA